MDGPVVGIAVVAFLVVLRHVAARRVWARQGQFVWFLFAPTLIGAIAILWAAITTFPSAPVFGALLAVGGVLYAGLLIRFLARLSRSVSSAGTQDDVVGVIVESLAEYALTWIPLLLGAAVIALIGLIGWAVILAVR